VRNSDLFLGITDLPLFYGIQTTYSVGTGGTFPVGKVAKAWC